MRPAICSRVVDTEVFSVRLVSGPAASLDLPFIYRNFLENIGVDAALDDLILGHVVRESDLCRFAGFEEDYIIICNAADYLTVFILHRFDGAFISDVILLVIIEVVGYSCRILIADLVGELRHDGILRARKFFGQLHCFFLHGSEIEPHPQVRSACASLHVESFHSVCAIVLEDIARPSFNDPLYKYSIDICLSIFRTSSPGYEVIVEKIFERCRYSVDSHVSGAEVHTAGNRTVDSAQVDHQLAVHIEPEVIVSGKLEDNVMPPVVQSVRGLGEAGFRLHSKKVIRFLPIILHGIEVFILSRIAVRKRFLIVRLIKSIQIFGIDRRKRPRLQIIEGEKLAMFIRFRVSFVSPQFPVNRKITAQLPLKAREILCAVKLKIA